MFFRTARSCIKTLIAPKLRPVTFFYRNSIFTSEEGTQQGDPEAPPLFVESIQTLVKKIEPKIYVWYLDDGNLTDDYKILLRYLKIILVSEKTVA